MKRSSAIVRRASMASNRLRTDVSPKPSVLQHDLSCCFFSKREDVGRLLHPFFLEEQLDLLLAQAFDVEGAARAEQLQVLDLLERAGKLAGAAGAGALLAGRGLLAHHVGVQIARAFLGKLYGFASFGRLSITTSTTCGMTSPARWMITVSPMRMSRPSRRFSPSPPMPLM